MSLRSVVAAANRMGNTTHLNKHSPHFTIAFTGHRPDKLGGYGPNPLAEKVKAAIQKMLRKYKRTHSHLHVISGMALGMDQWAAEAATYLKIPWTAAVPFDGQELRWPPEAQMHYAQLLKSASHIMVVTKELSGGRTATALDSNSAIVALDRRNHWMVDNCDLLVAIWDGSGGGTWNCIRYARNVGRDVLYVDPREL